MKVGLTFEEAFFGCEKLLEIPKNVTCTVCKGHGCKPGTLPITCNPCGGMGQVVQQQLFMTIKSTCPHCHGNGKVIADPCVNCKGKGHEQQSDTLGVQIPPGVDSGDRLKVGGKGFIGEPGSVPGDLFLLLEVQPSAYFKRDGFDIHSIVTVPLTLAILGGQINAPTMYGEEQIDIAPGTQPESVILLEKKGVPEVNALGTGDQYVHLKIEVPTTLTAQQKKLVQKLHNTMS